MLVIFEGVDGSGKTTACKYFVEKGWKRINSDDFFKDTSIPKFWQNRENFNFNTMFDVVQDAAASDEIFVMDRSEITGWIYTEIEGRPQFAPYDVSRFLRFLLDSNVKIVWFCCQNAKQYMLERGDDNCIAIDKHSDVHNSYRHTMRTLEILGAKILSFDFEEHDYNLIDSFCK